MIRPHRPWVLQLAVVVAVILIFAGFWGAYQWGWHRAGTAYDQASADNARYQAQVKRLRGELDKLRDQEIHLRSFRSIDEQATKQVKDSLTRLQQDNMELREQLQFYRNIVSPAKGRTGLNIQNFRIDQGAKPGLYHYRVTLIHVPQPKSRNRLVRGFVEVAVEGVQQGVRKRLSMANITSPRTARLNYSFKYFRQFEGTLRLPKGFKPQRASVRVVPRGRKDNDVLEKKIDWPLLARGS